MKLYAVPESLRVRLKAPLGRLIPNEKVSRTLLSELFASCKMLVSVGDATTDLLLSMGFTPHIQAVDGKEMRAERAMPKPAYTTQLNVRNPAGYISVSALDGVQSSVKLKKPVRVIVDGEEDLLTLPFIAACPRGTIVLYGQPGEGLVVVEVNRKSVRMALDLLRAMGIGMAPRR